MTAARILIEINTQEKIFIKRIFFRLTKQFVRNESYRFNDKFHDDNKIDITDFRYQ